MRKRVQVLYGYFPVQMTQNYLGVRAKKIDYLFTKNQ